jgi:hypothetical protein
MVRAGAAGVSNTDCTKLCDYAFSGRTKTLDVVKDRVTSPMKREVVTSNLTRFTN